MCLATPEKKKITKVFLILKVNEVMRIATPAVHSICSEFMLKHLRGQY